MSGAMSQVWGMINGLQIIVNFPLLQMEFPDLSGMMVENLIEIATFDIMPAEDVMNAAVELPEEDRDEDNFTEIGIESDFMIVNLGTMFLVFVVMLIMPACLICTGPCRSCWPWLDRKHKATATNLHGNVWIRFLMEGSLDIIICGALNYFLVM
mmetsp:Transcript_6845/g.9408  ORF Transcript_6845/g.9408 Transcript_6845/m.9408 type:complete len:154 (-) Transcript_6845:1424-1885(-)